MRHPAYPTIADLSREADAEERDIADLTTLRELRQVVADAFATASRADEIRHPDRRWMSRTYLMRCRTSSATSTRPSRLFSAAQS